MKRTIPLRVRRAASSSVSSASRRPGALEEDGCCRALEEEPAGRAPVVASWGSVPIVADDDDDAGREGEARPPQVAPAGVVPHSVPATVGADSEVPATTFSPLEGDTPDERPATGGVSTA